MSTWDPGNLHKGMCASASDMHYAANPISILRVQQIQLRDYGFRYYEITSLEIKRTMKWRLKLISNDYEVTPDPANIENRLRESRRLS